MESALTVTKRDSKKCASPPTRASFANSVVLIERQRANSQIAGGVAGKESADTTQTVIGALRKPRQLPEAVDKYTPDGRLPAAA